MKKALLAPLLFSALCHAQIENCASFKTRIDRVVDPATPPERVDEDLRGLADLGQTGRCYVQYLSNRASFQQFVQKFEGSRTDKQGGASVSGACSRLSSSSLRMGASYKSWPE